MDTQSAHPVRPGPGGPAAADRLRCAHPARAGAPPARLRGGGAAGLATRALDLAAAAVAKALGLGLPAAVLVLVLMPIEVSNIMPTLPGQLGTFEAAVLGATAGVLSQAEGVAVALFFHAQQALPQIPLRMMAMAGNSFLRDRSKRNST
ncbi:lysylphosphatidylglycerol synthase domain-containing protein [Streptomyces atratus]|uniref:lysylphosphatidylglycerol synthase domain-containing protein n=1 Tax=Streptomyces atratus TaxID=1893 RepID=UPI00364DC4A8